MKILRFIPVFLLPFLLVNCRMDRPTIQDSHSNLSEIAIGNLDQSSWTQFDLTLQRLRPDTETISRNYKRSTNLADASVKVLYGTYKILLSYKDDRNTVLFESCAADQAKEHTINTPQYNIDIQICELGKNNPVGVVKVDRADVTIKPVVVTNPPVGSFVAQHGLLTASGGKLLDQNKQPVQLKGMSFFWSQWSGSFWNKDVVAALKNDWKATLVRAAMGVEEGGYLTQANTEKERVKTVVDAAIEQGIYVLVDWHDHNATQHTGDAVAFFSEMAKLYGNQPNVIFEVFNEPTTVSWDEVKVYAETVIKAIRATGAKNLVVVGSPTWSQRVDLAADKPIADSNVAYTLHFYAGTHKQELRDKAIYAINKGLTLFVTEFGVCDASGNGNIDLKETDVWLAFLNKYQISWANWSLFDKEESASALKKGAKTNGAWTDSDLTESGTYVKKKLLE